MNSDGWWMLVTVVPDPDLITHTTGKTYYRNTLVQVFAKAKANETDWFQIGVNEWLERRYVRIVQINTTPPQGVIGNRWIEVNLLEQTLAVYDQKGNSFMRQ